MTRRDKINYYLDIAETVAERGTCLRRNFGAIIVKNDQIVSTGYVGAPRGRQNCSDLGYCTRDRMGVPRGQRYELCRSVHAEMNAIIHAALRGPCSAPPSTSSAERWPRANMSRTPSPARCASRLIINAGISTVIVRDDKENFRVINVADEWIVNDETLRGESNY